MFCFGTYAYYYYIFFFVTHFELAGSWTLRYRRGMHYCYHLLQAWRLRTAAKLSIDCKLLSITIFVDVKQLYAMTLRTQTDPLFNQSPITKDVSYLWKWLLSRPFKADSRALSSLSASLLQATDVLGFVPGGSVSQTVNKMSCSLT